jgi:HAD superfamily phosphatase
VIRDVSGSYRRAIQATVHHFSGWTPAPPTIDALKGEGRWNNDWEASLELLRRHRQGAIGREEARAGGSSPLAGETVGAGRPHPAVDSFSPAGTRDDGSSQPTLEEVVEVFSGFYFGGDPAGPPALWQGFIRQETLLVEGAFFADLSAAGVAWGFVSGAEAPSARFLLEERLGLRNPPLVAMDDAPQKPDPSGLLALAERLAAQQGQTLGPHAPPVAYLGDTVADVETVRRARQRRPDQCFLALAVSPPHLHSPERARQRADYERHLLAAGADHLLARTSELQANPGALITSLLARRASGAPSS